MSLSYRFKMNKKMNNNNILPFLFVSNIYVNEQAFEGDFNVNCPIVEKIFLTLGSYFNHLDRLNEI